MLQPVGVLGEAGFLHAGLLSDIVVLSDGRRILSSSRDGSIRLWDLETGRELRRYLRPEANDVWGILVLPGEKEFLTGDGDGCVTRWDLASAEAVATYQHAGPVFRLALRPGGTEFVATDNEKVAVLWNLETGKKLQTFKGHTDRVYTALFVAGGERLLTGAGDGKLKVWNVDTGECERTYEHELGDVYTMTPSPDGVRFAMCSGDEKLRVFDAETLEVVWAEKLEDDLKVVSWSPDGEVLATACEDRRLHLFNAKTGEKIRSIRVARGYHTPIAFTPDGRELISGDERMLYRHRIATGERILPERGDAAVVGGVRTLAVDQNCVYAAGSDEEVQLWSVPAGQPIGRHGVDGEVRAMAVSPDGTLLATGGEEGALQLRESQTGVVVHELDAQGTIEDVAFTRDGLGLVSVGGDDQAHLWDVQSGRKIRSLAGHENDLNGVAIAASGEMMVTVSDDKTARLWDLATGSALRVFTEIDGRLDGAVFLGDGRSFLVTANEPNLWGWLAPVMKREGALPRAKLRKLIGRLSDPEFTQREAATKELIARGPDLLPALEGLQPDHPEAVYRLREVKSKIRAGQYEGPLESFLEFSEDVSGLAADPTGRYWAAVVGMEADAKLVLGEIRDGKPSVVEELSDGHSPARVAFGPRGRLLVSGNRDGTVSLFALPGREPPTE